MVDYGEELKFISETIIDAYKKCVEENISIAAEDKSEFDLVTKLDYSIEQFIINAIKQKYPFDRIHSEEYNPKTVIKQRTWTIDPIDGTVNMSLGMPLFGIQCSLIVNDEPVLGSIYLPKFDELYTAVKGNGAYLNGKRIFVKERDVVHSVLSFGDYPHSRKNEAEVQHNMINILKNSVSKIRMFGAASIDFAFLAAGRTSGLVIFTKNKWDITPGFVICKEAGATISSLSGEYTFEENAIIATAGKNISEEILRASRG